MKLIISLLLLLVSSHISAQWIEKADGIYGANIQSMVTDGTSLFAGTTNGVYRSTDGGATWTPANSGLVNGHVNSMAVLGGNLYAGVDDATGPIGGGVYVSTNSGASWVASNSGLTNLRVNDLASIGPNLFVATYGGGVFISTNGGASWSPVNTGLTDLNARTLFASGPNLFAGTGFGSGALFLSTDNGANWTNVSPSSNSVTAMTQIGPNLFAGGNGVFLSTNNGLSWTPVNTGLTNTDVRSLTSNGTNLFAGTGGGNFLSINNGTSWAPANTGMTNPNVQTLYNSGGNLFCGTFGSLHVSTDNGSNWAPVATGLTNTIPYDLLVVGTSVYSGSTNGVHLTTNGGSNWSTLNSGLTNTIVHALEASDGSLFAGTDGGGIFRSSDNGVSWTAANSGLTNLRIRDFQVVGTNLFAGTFGGGVFLSTNNGVSWTQVNSGLSSTFVYKLAAIGSNLFAGTFAGCFLSVNNGASWTPVNTGLTSSWIQGLAASGTNLFAGTQGGGVFLSTNNGTTWTAVNNGLTPTASVWTYELTAISGRIFMAAIDGIYMTADNGANWTTINTGLSDPEAESMTALGGDLYAGIIGRNVWIRPATELGFSAAPTIASFSPTSGPVGTTVTITGTNFDATSANNIVSFGAARATVTGATSTQLTVTVPSGATYQPITVQVAGLTGFSSKPFVVSFVGGGSIDPCSFAPPIGFGTNPPAGQLREALVDLDGDGKLDVVSVDSDNDFLFIQRNTSTPGSITAGSLEARIILATGDRPISVAFGDLDGDGKPDLAVTNFNTGQLSVYKNLSTPGTISMAGKVDFAAPGFGQGIAIADIDLDGKLDVSMTSSFNGLTVLRNTSTVGVIDASSLATGISFATGPNPFNFSLGDLDGDGKIDASVPNLNAYSVSVLRNTSTPGTVAFASEIVLSTSAGSPPAGQGTNHTALGDIDGDGKTDLVVNNLTVNTISLYRNTSSTGTISFDPKFDLSVTFNGSVYLNDLDGDSKVDLIAEYSDISKSIYKNTASSGFIDGSSYSAPTIITTASTGLFTIGDMDGDGKADLVTNTGMVSILRNVIGEITIPSITSFSPSSGSIGTSVVISGTSFITPFSNTVRINGISAPITASTATSLTITIPVGATPGPFEVTIGCNSTTSATNFCIPPAPPAPIPGSRCGPGTVPMSASGATVTQEYRWYDIATGGTSLASTADFTTPTLTASTTYHVSILDTGCESARTAVTATINSVPTPPTTTEASRCDAGVLTLTASGGSPGQYRWYTVPTGGTADAFQQNDSFLTPSLTNSTTYHVAINDGTCESSRASVTATITNLGAPSVSTSACTASSVVLTGTNGFSSYLWSNGATTPSITVTVAGSYTLVVSDASGCTSPPSPAVAFSASFCNQPPTLVGTTVTTTVSVPVTIQVVALISDPDNNVDLTTLMVKVQPLSGATAYFNSNHELVVDYSGVAFAGTDELTIEVCDASGVCDEQVITIEVAGQINIFNAVSPNGDGKNEVFFLEYIDALPDTRSNKLTIFNRWGSVVFETTNYNNTTNVFKGIGNDGSELPPGTYYYSIEFSSGAPKRTGFISLRK